MRDACRSYPFGEGLRRLNSKLFIARKRSYRIVEVPIDWYYQAESRVRFLADPLRMLLDILTIRRNWWGGRYNR